MEISNLSLDFDAIMPTLLSLAVSLGRGVAILLVSWILAYFAAGTIRRLGQHASLDKATVINLLATVTRIGITVIGIITALGSMGVDVSALVAGLGLTGFAVGFALKDMLSNLLAGILVILYRPFRLQQYIMVSGHSGQVIQVDLRYTTLQAGEKQILVPNTVIFTKEVIVSDSDFTDS